MFFVVVLLGAVLVLLGLLGLGAFPPKPHVVPVEHTLPVDKLPADKLPADKLPAH